MKQNTKQQENTRKTYMLGKKRKLCKHKDSAIEKLNMLMEPKYSFVKRNGPISVMKVECNGKIFHGRGSTRKEAKRHAAVEALRALHFVQDINGHKNAITQLNELSVDRYWLVRKDGRYCVMNVEYDGQIFQGKGLTRKLAKQNTAQNALRSLLEAKNASKAHENVPNTLKAHGNIVNAPKAHENIVNAPKAHKNVVMQLNELVPKAKYSLTYLMNVEVNGEKYQGQGNTQIKAKEDAAKKALQALWLTSNEVYQPQASNSTHHSSPPGKIFTYA